MSYPWVKEANKVFIGVLLVQFILALIIAAFTGSWLEAVAFGLPMIALPIFMIVKLPDQQLTHIVVGIAVQLITALHIQQAFGLIEIHFEVFVVLAFLSFYRNWVVIAVSTAVVAIHHIGFFFLQSADAGVYLFEEGHVTLGILAMHALFALAEAVVLMYVAKRSLTSGTAAWSLSNVVHEILADKEKLNLNVTLDDSNEELKEFNVFVRSIRELIEKTMTVSHAVNSVSMHVAELSKNLQQSLDSTSVQVDSIASSSEEMSSTIAHVADNVKRVNQIASDAKTTSTNAKEIIESTNTEVSNLKTDLENTSLTINALSVKCDRISQVMEAIKVVSDQTNLLALNAAIESARAGDHGRGFAVVADEVRQLAIKTRESVEEISEVSSALISDGNTSVAQMKECLAAAEKAMDATSNACNLISDVSDGITNVENSIASVASSTEEQSIASNTIAQSAQQLYDLSQQESASAKMTASEVEILRQHSKELEHQLARFNV